MTPERIKEWKHTCQMNKNAGCPVITFSVEYLDDLLDSALRLAAIEGAGDEEVERLLDSFYRGVERLGVHPIERLRDAFKVRNATIADLRAKLGEAEQRIEFYEELVNNLRESEVGGG